MSATIKRGTRWETMTSQRTTRTLGQAMTNAPHDDSDHVGSVPVGSDVNPYQASVSPATESTASATRQRPRGVTVFGIMGCIAGGMACLGALMGVGGAVINHFMRDLGATGGTGTQAGEAMNAAAAEITEKYMVANLVFLVILAVLGVLMLVGGIKLLSGKESGRVMLRRVFLFMCAFEVARSVPYIMGQLEMIPVLRHFMQDMAKEQQQQSGAPAEMMEQVAWVTMVIVLVLAGLWVLAKFVFYLWGGFYLKSDAAKQFCQDR